MTIANVFSPSAPTPLSRAPSRTPSTRSSSSSSSSCSNSTRVSLGKDNINRTLSLSSSTRGARPANTTTINMAPTEGTTAPFGRHSNSSPSLARHSSSSSVISSTTWSTSATAGRLEACSHSPQSDDEAVGCTDNAQSERTMGLGSAILMIVGTLIGTGIFASPGPLFDAVQSTQTSFIIWTFAGLICTIGAYAYAELGTMFPASGGDFNYLSLAYGRRMGLTFGWTFIMVLNPVGTSGTAGVLGRYVVDLIHYSYLGGPTGGSGAEAAHGSSRPPTSFGGAGGDYYWSGNDTMFGPLIYLNETVGIDDRGHLVHLKPHSPYAPSSPAYNASTPQPPLSPEAMEVLIRVFSVGAILLMGAINVFFKEGGKYASNILAILKLAGMSLLIIIGSMAAAKNHAHSEPLMIPIEDSSRNVLDYVSALCFAFFAYNGFNNINLGLGELRNPERNLKWAVCLAMPLITVLFLLANFALFSILSSHDLRHIHSLTLHAGHKVLGTPGGYLMAGTVIASALGSINASIWAGSRLLVTLANDNEIVPHCVARTWSRTGTQAFALMFLIVQASFHALIGLDYKQFSKIYSAVGWTWYGLSIIGLLYLRKKKPHLPRPVKIWSPLAVLFIAVASFLVLGALLLAFGSKTLLHPSPESAGGSDEAAENNGPPVEWGTVGMVIFVFVMIACSGCAIRGTRWYNHREQRLERSSKVLQAPKDHSQELDEVKNSQGCASLEECEGLEVSMSSQVAVPYQRELRHSKVASVSMKEELETPKPVTIGTLHEDALTNAHPRVSESVLSDMAKNEMDNYRSRHHCREHSLPGHQQHSRSRSHPRSPSRQRQRRSTIQHQHNTTFTSIPLHSPNSERPIGPPSFAQDHGHHHDINGQYSPPTDETIAVASATDHAFRHRHLHRPGHSPHHQGGLHHRHASLGRQSLSFCSVVHHPRSPSSPHDPFRLSLASPTAFDSNHVAPSSKGPQDNNPHTSLSPLASSVPLPSLSSPEPSTTLARDLGLTMHTATPASSNQDNHPKGGPMFQST